VHPHPHRELPRATRESLLARTHPSPTLPFSPSPQRASFPFHPPRLRHTSPLPPPPISLPPQRALPPPPGPTASSTYPTRHRTTAAFQTPLRTAAPDSTALSPSQPRPFSRSVLRHKPRPTAPAKPTLVPTPKAIVSTASTRMLHSDATLCPEPRRSTSHPSPTQLQLHPRLPLPTSRSPLLTQPFPSSRNPPHRPPTLALPSHNVARHLSALGAYTASKSALPTSNVGRAAAPCPVVIPNMCSTIPIPDRTRTPHTRTAHYLSIPSLLSQDPPLLDQPPPPISRLKPRLNVALFIPPNLAPRLLIPGPLTLAPFHCPTSYHPSLIRHIPPSTTSPM